MIIKIKKLHVGGIAFYPFIFIQSGLDQQRTMVLLNHERIHLRQQVELLILPFYLIYLLNYLILLLIYRDHRKAYRNIAFEKEAFRYESDDTYLKKRKLFAFLKK